MLKPGDWGYKLSVLMDKSIVEQLETERESALEWARSKAKNPKRVSVKPEPWEELENRPGTYQVRFSWKDGDTYANGDKWSGTWKDGDKFFPVIVDTEGTTIEDKETPIYSGSQVKVAFFQKPYVLPTGDIGTSLKLKAIQLISLNTGAGVVDDGDMTPEAATELFGTTKGFKVAEPNPGADESTDEDEDF